MRFSMRCFDRLLPYAKYHRSSSRHTDSIRYGLKIVEPVQISNAAFLLVAVLTRFITNNKSEHVKRC